MDRAYSEESLSHAVVQEDFRFPEPEVGVDQEAERLHEFQSKSMEFLETHGLVERRGSTLIADISGIKKLTGSFIDYNPKNFYRYYESNKKDTDPAVKKKTKDQIRDLTTNFPDMCKDEEGGNDLVGFLMRTFHDVKVVDKEDVERWEDSGRKEEPPQAKKLFYEPNSKKDAFDPSAIKRAQFHIGAWEVLGKRGKEYSPFLPGVPYDEASLACVLYNQKYGDGKRDVQGNLLVAYPDGKHKKLSLDWIEAQKMYGGIKANTSKDTFMRSPRLYLENGLFPELVSRKLLLPSDFQSMSGSEVSGKFGQEKRITQAAGQVTIDGVRYTLGRQFGTGEYSVYKMSNKHGGISKVDEHGKPQLLYTFDLVKPDDPRVKHDIMPYFGKRDGLVIRKYEEDADVGSLAGLSEHPALLELKKELVKETGLSMEHLEPREQAALLSFYKKAGKAGKKRLDAFVQRYKDIGLRAFLALQYDTNAGEKIFAIDDAFETPEAALILRAYAELMRSAEHVDEEMQKALGVGAGGTKETNVRASQEIVKRADGFVSQFTKVQPGNIDPQEVLERIKRFNTELSSFSAMFKSEFKGKPVDLREVAALDYESKNGSTLSNSEKQEMIRIAHENYPDEPVAEELEELLYPRSLAGIQALENNEFVFLKKNKKASAKEKDIVSFLRVEERGRNRVYVGALNVNPTARGSGLGEHMIAQTLQDLHRDKDIEAVAVPELVAGTHYVEQVGFEGKRFVDAHEAHGTRYGWFEIEYPREATPSVLRSKKPAELLSLYTQLFAGDDPLAHVGKPFILARFDTATQMDEVTRVSAALLNEHGYRLTKYLSLDSSGMNRLYGFEKVESPTARQASSAPRRSGISKYGSAPQPHA